ncbi:MAG: hypothetical protein QE271_09725 [Bacteriovoracaceae bacterium]|nr:hypothetical protein [Bacteriovoracaceae bacterium]
MTFGIILLILVYVLWSVKKSIQKRKRSILRDEMESLGKDNDYFHSPICGKITKLLSQNGASEIHVVPDWFMFQELRAPMDSEIINVKYFNPSRGLGKFWKMKKRRHLQIDLKIWFADPLLKMQEQTYTLICHGRWGSILPILNLGDLIKSKGRITLSCNFKLIKIKIPGKNLSNENITIGKQVNCDTSLFKII